MATTHRLLLLGAACAVASGQLRHYPPYKTIDQGANPALGCALLEGNYIPVESYADCDQARIAFDTNWHWKQPECGEVGCTSQRPQGCTHHPNFGHFNLFPTCNTASCGAYGMNCVCIDADARRERRQEPPPRAILQPPPPRTARAPPAVSCGSACAAAPAIPAPTGCNGKLLTDPSNIEAESGVVRNADAVKVTPNGRIDLRDTGCLRLGTPKGPTASFSLSFWLKAGTSSDCFAVPIVRGERGDGAAIIGKRVDAREHAGWKIGTIINQGKLSLELKTRAAGASWSINHDIYLKSALFSVGDWAFVVFTYDAVTALATLTVNSKSESKIMHPFNNDGNWPGTGIRIGDSRTAFALHDMRSYAGLLPAEDQLAIFGASYADFGFSVADLAGELASVAAWVAGTAVPDATGIERIHSILARNSALLQLDEALMRQILDVIEAFETGHVDGPLFLNARTRSFDREANDDLALLRAVFAVQQTAIDMLFTPATVRDCGSCVLEGRDFKTAEYMPGNGMTVKPPADPLVVHTVDINASMPQRWGRPAAFDQQPERQPTGLYVAPGALATVTVPESWVARGGFEVLVGAHTWDHQKKSTHKRFDRITTRFAITATTTHIANPLGGGVYIMVPYLAAEAVGSIQITGGVIEAPFFKLDSWDESRGGTTEAEWLTRRTAPAPWAVLATDKFMTDVPSSWISATTNITGLMRKWDTIMDGVSSSFGRPPSTRNKKVCYYQPDVTLPGGAHGIGYPQVNHLWNPLSTRVGHRPIDGYANSWYIRLEEGLLSGQIEFHETGHAQGAAMYRGEGEAIVNFIHPYVNSRKLGKPLDEAFRQSFNKNSGYTIDEAANHWMITDNFRRGNDMDKTNSENNQIRYQERGYAKYADVADMFGWEAYEEAFLQENIDYEAGTAETNFAGPKAVLKGTDQRTLRFSAAAGFDLTPLIHFWGIRPEHPTELTAELTRRGLGPSQAIHDMLLRRATEVLPANNVEFNEHFERQHPGRPGGGNPLYGRGWYNEWRGIWGAEHAAGARGNIQKLLDLYFPVQTWTEQYLAKLHDGVDASAISQRCYVGLFAGDTVCSGGGVYKLAPAVVTSGRGGAAADPLKTTCGEITTRAASWTSELKRGAHLVRDGVVLATYQAKIGGCIDPCGGSTCGAAQRGHRFV